MEIKFGKMLNTVLSCVSYAQNTAVELSGEPCVRAV